MDPALWLKAARKRLAAFARTIEDIAPSSLYGATIGATLLPLAMTSGDPREVLAGLIGGIGANLIANQLEAWKDRDLADEIAVAKALTNAAKADPELRAAFDELLKRIDALEVVIHEITEDDRQAIVDLLDRQFAKAESKLDVQEIFVGGDWIRTGDIANSSYVAVGKDIVIAGPGAHVGDVYNFPHAPDPAARNARRQAYLHHLYSEARRLSLDGIDRKVAGDDHDVAVPLDAIYTALLTTAVEVTVKTPVGQGRASVNLDAFSEERKPQQISAVAQLNRHDRLVLLGAPGSGKSTFVNFVALCLAGQELSSAEVNLELLTTPLPDEDDRPRRKRKDAPPRQPWDHGGLIPVRVILRHFAAYGLPAAREKATANHLWQYICDELDAATLGDFVTELQEELRQHGGLILLDGLDEVPDADQQRAQLKAVITAFAGAYRKCRILITSRSYAYHQEDWALTGFTDTTLASFTDAQIRRFVDRWYENAADSRNYRRDDAQARAAQLKQAIFRNDRLHALAEQPLLLTLMSSLHAWRGSELPDKREKLYEEAVDLLLHRWERQRVETRRDGTQLQQPSLQEYLQVGRTAILGLLERIAYEVHAGQPELTGCADIAREQLILGLVEISKTKRVIHEELVNYLSQRAGLLLPEGNTLYRFPHRTFQEYLAACYLTSPQVKYPRKLGELVHANPERWREVMLLAAAKAANGHVSLVWSLVNTIARVAPSNANFTLDDAWGAHLGGQALLESVPRDDLDPTEQQSLARVREGLIYVMRSAEFVPSERALAGRTLASLGDPRFRVDAWYLPNDPMLGFVAMPAGTFTMGEGKEAHQVALPEFYIARYPVTVAQFRAFVESTGEQPSYSDSLADPDNHPVGWLTWHEVTRYCAWLTKILGNWAHTPLPLAEKLQQGWQVMLPSEAEWERTTRGLNGRLYPWGNEDVDSNRANYEATGIGATSAVGCFPAGATPEGVEELSGNVYEWTRSLYLEYPYPSDEQGRSERERFEAEDRDRFSQRGGYYGSRDQNMRAPARDDLLADYIFSDCLGFRLVVGGGCCPR